MKGDDERIFEYNKGRAEGGESKRGNKNHCQKSKKKDKHAQNHNISEAYVQILGTGMDTHDTLPSVYLHFDNLRIIFNAGEGLQRFCAEHKIKLSKIDYICFSRVCSETVGGLPGLLLTLRGINQEPSIEIRGPSNLSLLIRAMRSFIPRSAIQAKIIGSASSDAESPVAQSLSEDAVPVCSSSTVNISAILLEPSSGEDFISNPSDKSVVYICEVSKNKGKFHPERAEALGLVEKRKYGQLQRGESVRSDHLDIMVHPSDVMDPPMPGPIVFIVDCPTKRHAEKLFITQSLSCYYSDIPGNKAVNCIIHLTPASVVNIPIYQTWMKKFCSAQHIMAGHAMKNMQTPILKSSARIAIRLNYLCPQFLQAPVSWSVQQNNVAEFDFCTSSEIRSIAAENLLKFTLHPHARLGLNKSDVPSQLATTQVIDELLSEIPDVIEAAQQIDQLWCKPEEREVDMIGIQDSTGRIRGAPLNCDPLPCCLESICRDDAEIVLLGTGCSQPSKYRNVSSIYVNLYSKGGLLLDCGEGTLAQLTRRYGVDAAANAVTNLKCIWISHIHADHHAGLARILALRRDLLMGMPHEPLHVIGPKQLATFLDEYNSLEDLNMQFLDCRSTTSASWEAFDSDSLLTKCQGSDCRKNNYNREDADPTSLGQESRFNSCSKRQKLSVPDGGDFLLLKSLEEVLREAGLERLTSFPVVHCPEAFGVILKARDRLNNAGTQIPGWKVVYSGDTRPCMEVIKASRGATLLIHEATYEDGCSNEAVARNHSTMKEAIGVGDAAGVYRIILTHFSQRYPKISSIDEINSQKTCIAFDLMSINMADLPVLPRVLPYFKLLFRDDATYEDGCSNEAVARNHCIMKEAIGVGDAAGVYRLILTPFSQRYPKISSIDEINSQKTCIAFDHMSINMADLPVLP